MSDTFIGIVYRRFIKIRKQSWKNCINCKKINHILLLQNVPRKLVFSWNKCFFLIGQAKKIKGSYFLPYNNNLPNKLQLSILNWLSSKLENLNHAKHFIFLSTKQNVCLQIFRQSLACLGYSFVSFETTLPIICVCEC